MKSNHRSTSKFGAFILIVLAYEWIASGLDKIINGSFASGLRAQMEQNIPHMQYHFYGGILKAIGLNHAILLGNLVQYGELAVGLIFASLAIGLWRNRLHPTLLVFGSLTALVAAFMNLNFFFYQGGSFFVNPSDPFDEGIPIDLIMFFIELGISYAMFNMLRRRVKQAPGTVVNTTLPRNHQRNQGAVM